MLEVHLYGELRRYAPDSRPDRESVVKLEMLSAGTVGTVLKRLGISPDEVHHVFVNHKLLSSRNTMALWLGYRQVREGLVGRSVALDAVVQPGDRLALFAHDMALLVI